MIMKSKRIKSVVAGIALALCVAFAAVFGGCRAKDGRDGINGKDLNIFDIYEAAKQETGNYDMTFEEFLKEYLSYTPGELEEATSLKAAINKSLMSAVTVQADFSSANASNRGSGVIIDIDRIKGDMLVITNCHVLYNAAGNGKYSDSVYLWLYGSESSYPQVNAANAIPAKIVGASLNYDLALLKVTASDLVKRSKAERARWSRAEENYLGETVYAVGNANDQTLSANVGYISKDLEAVTVDIGSDKYTYNVMRTSATISAGNSGGGLFNGSGELVGIVNAKGKDTVGVGYAIPSSTARRIINRMILDNDGTEKHYVRLLQCGIDVYVSDSYSTGLNDKGFAEIYEQVTVKSIKDTNDPAFNKIETGDVITRVKIMQDGGTIEDMKINRLHNFTDLLLSVEVGNTVQITVLRGEKGEEKVFTLNYKASHFGQIA